MPQAHAYRWHPQALDASPRDVVGFIPPLLVERDPRIHKERTLVSHVRNDSGLLFCGASTQLLAMLGCANDTCARKPTRRRMLEVLARMQKATLVRLGRLRLSHKQWQGGSQLGVPLTRDDPSTGRPRYARRGSSRMLGRRRGHMLLVVARANAGTRGASSDAEHSARRLRCNPGAGKVYLDDVSLVASLVCREARPSAC